MSFTTAHFVDPEPVHSHVKQYVTIGLSLGTILILLFVVGGMMSHKSTTSDTQPRGVVPILIKDKQDLNAALKAYDNAGAAAATNTDTIVKAGLNQNSQDVSQFSQ